MVLYANNLDSTTVIFSVEERIYKLERDDEAMLKRIKDTNMKATGVDGFIYSRIGPLADLQNKEMSLA